MAEEFEESEVIFQENSEEDDRNSVSNVSDFRNKKGKRKKVSMDTRSKNCSIPMRIPENGRNAWRRCGVAELEGGDGELVPPHEITGRRAAGEMMAFSVCTGNGRTLKGRDLSQVRNSVLRMTGFLET